MSIMSPEQADALLARGVISPEQHQAIVGPVMSAAPPVPPPMPVAEPAPPAPQPYYVDMIGGSQLPPVSAMRGGFPSMSAPPPTPVAPGLDGALQQLAAAQPPPAPRGDVQVGPITATPPPPEPDAPKPPAPKPAGGGGGGRDPRLDMVAHEQAALAGKQDTARRSLDLDAQRAVEMRDMATQQRDAAEQQYVLDKAAKQREQSQIDAKVAERQQAIDDYANAKVDPDKYWQDRGPVRQALAALAIGLGAFAEGYSGGKVKNTAAEMIQRDIDRNIRAQEIEIEKKGKRVGMADNSIAQLRALAGDNEAARAAEKIRQLDMWQKEIAATSARYDSEKAQVNGQQTIADLEAEKTRLRDSLNLTLRKEAAASAAAQAAAARQQMKDERQYGLDVAKVRIEAAKAGASSGEAAQKKAALAADLAQFESAFKMARENQPMRGTGSLPSVTQGGKRFDAAVSRLQSMLKGQGESSDADALRIKAVTPQPGDDEETIARKYELGRAAIVSKHASPSAVADEAARNPDNALGFVPVK